MKNPKTIIFNGTKYCLMSKGKYYLSNSSTNQGRKRPKGLHVAIWEFYNNSAVPEDHVVHHKDGDTHNNDISNLECISHEQHMKEHRLEKSIRCRSKSHLEHLGKIRPLASKWHSSDEGKKWHSENSKKHYDKIFKPRTLICKTCEQEFVTRRQDPKVSYCSLRCWNRNRMNNMPLIICSCIICGNEFESRKRTSAKRQRKTCSPKCRGALVTKER